MSIFFRRDRSGDDSWLSLKIGLFSFGALLALFGVGMENDWLIGAAVLVLGAGFLLRFLPAPDRDEDDIEQA